MRIVTWNVNSLKARLPRVLELLEELRPDALCLQETKVAPEAFPQAELADAGYGAVHSSSGRWCRFACRVCRALRAAASKGPETTKLARKAVDGKGPKLSTADLIAV